MSERERKQNDFYVIVISTREERDQLKDLCIKHNIPLTYHEMFEEKVIQPLWGISNDGIGLVGTVVARNTPKDHIIHYVQELDNILNNF